MRFLFVYQDRAKQARELLDSLAIRDVTLIVAQQDAPGPTAEEIEMLNAHQGATAAACEINRKYRKIAACYVTFCCEPKKFRFEDQQLREWLTPKNHVSVAHPNPSTAFLAASVKSPKLVLHPDALNQADELVEHRWQFASLGSGLLARYSHGEELGPLRGWKATHGVDFAANGRVAFKYRATCGTEVRDGRSEWHLKEGDNTTRESAARIYFARVDFTAGPRVLVFYVGPHPDDGERFVLFLVSSM